MKKRQSDKKTTKQVRIDVEQHKLLKIVAAQSSKSMKSLIEAIIAEFLAIN